MKKSIRILVAVLVITSMLLPRVAELTKFTAADEPFWLVVGANYYYALTHGEFENTVYEYHPAVTTMWIGAAAMLVYFPEYLESRPPKFLRSTLWVKNSEVFV